MGGSNCSARSPHAGFVKATLSSKAIRTTRCLLVSIYMGMRQASRLDEPVVLLSDFEKALSTVLRAIVQPDRMSYFAQFVKWRTALAIKVITPH